MAQEELDEESQEYLTVAQAAKKLNYKERAIRQMLARGTLRGTKIRRKWLIYRGEIDLCLQSGPRSTQDGSIEVGSGDSDEEKITVSPPDVDGSLLFPPTAASPALKEFGQASESNDRSTAWEDSRDLRRQIWRQLPVPGPMDDLWDSAVTKSPSRATARNAPGSGWLLGRGPQLPTLRIEESPEFFELRARTPDAEFWHKFELVREGLGEYVALCIEGIEWIEGEAGKRSGRPITTATDVRGGSLTPQFAWTVYCRGLQELLGTAQGPRLYRGDFPKGSLAMHLALESHRLWTPGGDMMPPPPPNKPLFYSIDGSQLVVIACLSGQIYPQRLRAVHSGLIDEWIGGPRAKEILDRYVKLSAQVTDLRRDPFLLL